MHLPSFVLGCEEQSLLGINAGQGGIGFQYRSQLLQVGEERPEHLADLLGGQLDLLKTLLQLRPVLFGEFADLPILYGG